MSTSRFNHLVERHYSALFAIAARLTSSPAAALALTQRALRRVSENEAIPGNKEALQQVFLLEIAATVG